MRNRIAFILALLPLCGLLSLTPVCAAEPASSDELTTIAREAYIYFYPLVTMDISRRVMTNVTPGKKPGFGPANMFSHVRAFPDASFRSVVRPNFDTLYSSGWVDLTRGPVIVSVPNTEGRYYLLPMLDMWSDVFASPGKRTTGTGAGDYALVPPGWNGKLPEKMTRIDTPTPYVWIIGRTQTNGPADYAAVNRVQDGYTMKPLTDWDKDYSTISLKHDPSVDMETEPLKQVNDMPAERYFAYAVELLKVNAPHLTDQPILARMRRLGIEPGQIYAPTAPEVKKALEQGAAEGLKLMREKVPTLARSVNGWQMNTDTMGVYGTYYLKRAIVAMVGLGANVPEDAIYPLCTGDTEGQPLTGENKYTLHFEKSQLPPVEAFWSLTMYDAEGYQTANSINRFALGDRDALKYNADGSLDISIQHDNPGPDRASNWLPAPATGTLGLTMRLYAPKAPVLDGAWAPPAVVKVK